MSTSVRVLLILLLLNFLFAVFYLLRMVHRDRAKRDRYFCESVFMILCPAVGMLFLFLSWLAESLYFQKRRVDDLSFFEKDKKQIYEMPDWEAESNTVPFEETLLVSVRKDKRSGLLRILKSDYQKSLSLIAKALEDEDTETSHYAASILMQELEEFQLNTQKMQKAFEDNPEDYEICRLYIDYLAEFLRAGVLSEFDTRRYTYQLNEAAEKVFLQFPNQLEAELMERAGELLIKQKDVAEAKKWADRLYDTLPDQVEGYRLLLKLYFITENHRDFFTLLEKLKGSDITLEQDMLEMIRFFSAGSAARQAKPEAKEEKPTSIG